MGGPSEAPHTLSLELFFVKMGYYHRILSSYFTMKNSFSFEDRVVHGYLFRGNRAGKNRVAAISRDTCMTDRPEPG